jgi:hypothetical protein
MGGDLFWKWIAGPQMEGGNAFSIPTSLAKTSISGSESRGPEDRSDYQEAIDEAKSAQVAKRWTRTMMKYGVEARGPSSLVNSRFGCRIQYSMCSPRSAGA